MAAEHLAAMGITEEQAGDAVDFLEAYREFSDMRHTHATLLLEAGVDITMVSKRLGHASAKTTADLYAHITERLQTTAAERFGAYILAREIPTLPALRGSMT